MRKQRGDNASTANSNQLFIEKFLRFISKTKLRHMKFRPRTDDDVIPSNRIHSARTSEATMAKDQIGIRLHGPNLSTLYHINLPTDNQIWKTKELYRQRWRHNSNDELGFRSVVGCKSKASPNSLGIGLSTLSMSTTDERR